MNKEELIQHCATQFYVYGTLNNKMLIPEKQIVIDSIKRAKVFADIYEEIISENN